MISATAVGLLLTSLALIPSVPVELPPGFTAAGGGLWELDGCTAETTCSSGAVISCSAGPGATCTSQNGTSVTCGTCSITCSSVNPWYLCRDACQDDRAACIAGCPHKMPYFEYCITGCEDDYSVCLAACGPAPPLSCSG